MDLEKLVSSRKYDIRKLIVDVLILILIGVSLGYIAFVVRSLSFYDQIKWVPELIWTSLFVIVLLVFFTLLKPILNNLYHWFFSILPWSRIKSYNFLPKNDLSNLTFQGIAKETNNALYLTNSRAGALLRELQWKNFIAEFSFKFENLEQNFTGRINEPFTDYKANRFNYVGFLFRAQSLEDYFMISIGVEILEAHLNQRANQNELEPLIRPHIRLNGKWEKFGQERLSTLIKINTYNKVKITAIGNKVVVDINHTSFVWILPTNFEIGSVEQDKDNKEKFGDGTRIPFYNQYGMIGFRAADEEHVLIKDIKIEKI